MALLKTKNKPSTKELEAFKEFAKILLAYSEEDIRKAIENGVLIELRV